MYVFYNILKFIFAISTYVIHLPEILCYSEKTPEAKLMLVFFVNSTVNDIKIIKLRKSK